MLLHTWRFQGNNINISLKNTLPQKGEDFLPLDALSKEMEEDWNPWFPPAFGGTHMQDLSWSTTQPIHTADQSNLMNVWFHVACNLDIHTNTLIPISLPTFHLWLYHVCIHICVTKSIHSFSYLLNKYHTFPNLGMNNKTLQT